MGVQDQITSKMTAALEHFKEDLKNIRTSRANPGMVESLLIEVYGKSVALRSIALIAAPEPRQLVITPFDPKNVGVISKGINNANIGFTPIAEGNCVRIKIPPMTEELRKKMAKICHDEKEKAKVSIRNIRREANDLIRKQKNDGDIAEDMMKKLEKAVQELTDKFCKQADELAEKKEKEISTI